MNNRLRSENRKKDFDKKWSKIFNYRGSDDYQLIIDHLKYMDNKNLFSDRIVILLKLDELRPLHTTSSIERFFGYSAEEFIKENHFYALGNNPTQAATFLKIAQCISDFHSPDLDKSSYNIKYISAGVPFLHKDGSLRRSLTKYHIDEIHKGVLPPVDIIVTYDVTPLMKGDQFWIYQEKIVNGKFISRFYTDSKTENFLITPREKEILQLIASGKSSKMIGDILNISLETVGQHRKNMIKRTLARDSSSLIQLCKICEVI